jgi:hypothetical protein
MKLIGEGKKLFTILLSSQLLWGVEIEIEKTKDWGSGFCASAVVVNDQSEDVQWDLSFDAGGVITSAWNVNYDQDSDTLVTQATGVSWNRVVRANATRSFGYCANIKRPSAGDLEVSQTTQDEWNGGFCNRVEVRNLRDYPINWDTSFPVEGTIFTLWNAQYEQDEQSLETKAKGVESNDIIPAGDSISFGYCADVQEEEKEEEELFEIVLPPLVEDIVYDDLLDALFLALLDAFDVGFGGGYSIPFASEEENKKIWVSSVDLILKNRIEYSGYYNKIKDFDRDAFDELQKSLKSSKFVVYWLTSGWKESWFSRAKIQKAMDKGIVPVFNYWYFGDKLDGIPSEERQAQYREDNLRLVTFLNKLQGTKLLIMEPEFNKREILSSENRQYKFASIMADAIDTIRAKTTNVYFSLAMTDTGSRGVNSTYEKCEYDMCALGDKGEWSKPEIIYNSLSSRLDFISFQQMVAQFSRDPSNSGTWDNPIPIAYSNEDIGIDYLAQRVANFATFLKEKYNKPVFLPYITIATATWSDSNGNSAIEESEIDTVGWEDEANRVYEELSSMKGELQEKGLFGFAVMSLFDNPQQDAGGYQYFMQNEYHFGILKSSAQGGISIAAHGDIKVKGDLVDTIFNTP